jgi:hypothetical protein
MVSVVGMVTKKQNLMVSVVGMVTKKNFDGFGSENH